MRLLTTLFNTSFCLAFTSSASCWQTEQETLASEAQGTLEDGGTWDCISTGGKTPFTVIPFGKRGEEQEVPFGSLPPMPSNTVSVLLLKRGSLCQNPPLNCTFSYGDGTEQQRLLQSLFQVRDGFCLRCSQGHGSTFVSYISQLFKATTVPSFISYTSKSLWPHLLTVHKLCHLLFIRKYIIFVLKSSVWQKPSNSFSGSASTKTHYILFTKKSKNM